MDYAALGIHPETLSTTPPVRQAAVDADRLPAVCSTVRQAGGNLQALWASDERDHGAGFRLNVALQDTDGLLLLHLVLPQDAPEYPGLDDLFPAAIRMQRAAFDLVGVRARDADQRPWLRHAAWPAACHPLRRDADVRQPWPARQDDYSFVAVSGDGVHEIPVGPVHAGVIEPGHFRFSVVGEKVLRLEEWLGYVHKGIEKRFESLSALEGHRLAARVSGDSAVAFSWAYCMALEHLCATPPPDRALWLRALALERERIANHLGDLGALGNDAGLSFGQSQFSRLKEDLLRVNAQVFGRRYLMDAVVPGGVDSDLTETQRRSLQQEIPRLATEVGRLRRIYDDHAGVQDRFMGCGRVSPERAARLGLIGLAGRASGQCHDLRRAPLAARPYDQLDVHIVNHDGGDVAARVWVRFEETFESLRLCHRLLDALPAGPARIDLPALRTQTTGIGWIEGWRGPVLVALEVDDGGTIRRCHPHDPSWQNWPVLEHAVIDNIVADFPLINKSFNLSYSGPDL